MFIQEITDEHRRVIESLRDKVEVEPPSQVIDHVRLMRVKDYDESITQIKEYRCACGIVMNEVDRSLKALSHFILDDHTLTCPNCSTTDRVRFSYLRKALKLANEEMKKSANYPYI